MALESQGLVVTVLICEFSVKPWENQGLEGHRLGGSCTTGMESVLVSSWMRDVKPVSQKFALCHPCSNLPQRGDGGGICLFGS